MGSPVEKPTQFESEAGFKSHCRALFGELLFLSARLLVAVWSANLPPRISESDSVLKRPQPSSAGC